MTATAQRVFDQKHYVELIEARGETIRKIVPELGKALQLSTALDAGCGLGFFAQILSECQLEVTGVDGRQTNVEEARRRYPRLRFETEDIEGAKVVGLGSFDLVLCFGLLYHLENPLRASRHLRALTGKVLLLESMCLPSNEPFALLREERPFDDQSLTNMAFYPSEGCIVKMLYRSGFSSVYRVSPLPEHDDFRETKERRRARTVLVAGLKELSVPGLQRMEEPREEVSPWSKEADTENGVASRARRFLKMPLRRKAAVAVFRGLLHLREPVRLPFGARWVPRNDHIGNPASMGEFEAAELAFVQRFLKSGMTVLDVGAHHGLYSLLASMKVGHEGRVYSFEPSPRERKALRLNLALNGSRNVSVQGVALGKEAGTGELHLVEEQESGCNSLRPPAVSSKTRRVKVQVTTLDEFVAEANLRKVDFVKLDVEGAELDVLRGGRQFLERAPRPVLLVEVYDIRTQPWGYAANQIVQFLDALGYKWFGLESGGSIVPIAPTLDVYDQNLVAIPQERMDEVLESIGASALSHV